MRGVQRVNKIKKRQTPTLLSGCWLVRSLPATQPSPSCPGSAGLPSTLLFVLITSLLVFVVLLPVCFPKCSVIYF